MAGHRRTVPRLRRRDRHSAPRSRARPGRPGGSSRPPGPADPDRRSTTWASRAASSGRSSTRFRSTRGPSPGGRRRTATWSPRSRRPSRRSRPTLTGSRSRTAPGSRSRRRRRADVRRPRRGSDLRQEVPAPRLRRLDRVERVQVQVDDPGRRVGDVRREALEQAVGPVEAAGPDQPRDEPEVLRQEPMRVGDADPGRDREQLVRLGDAGHADVDRQRRCPRRGARASHVAIAPGSKQSWVVM